MMTNRFFLPLTCSALLMLSAFMNAQPFWTPTAGPYGGGVAGFGKATTGMLYCGTLTGVYRSSDNGDHWEFCSPNLPVRQITHFLMTPGNAMLAVAGSQLYVSNDFGVTWQRPASIGAMSSISDIEFDPFFGVVYLTGSPSGGTSPVYRSFDHGGSWQAASNGITNNNVQAVAVNKQNGFAFINTFAGVFRSTNKGDSWQQMNGGITNQGMFGYAIAVNDQGTIFAGFSSGSMGGTSVPGAMYISTNQAASWTLSNTGLGTPDVHIIACSPHGEVYAVNSQENGVLFRSTNNGASWDQTPVGWITTDWSDLFFNGADAYVGTNMGVQRSRDNGATWALANEGLMNAPITDLIADGNQSMYVASMNSGMYRTTNAGSRWTQQLAGLDKPDMVAVARTKKGTILAAQNMGSVFRSIDGGTNWMKSDSGKPPLIARHFSLAVSDSDHVFLSVLAFFSIGGKLRSAHAIYRSRDDGISWQITTDSLAQVQAQHIAFDGPSEVVAAGYSGIYRSFDHGWSWSKLNNAIGTTATTGMHLNRQTKRLFVATQTGLFVSTDRGDTFSRIDTIPPTNATVVTSNCDVVLFSTSPTDARISTDMGQTWTQITSGLEGREIQRFLWTPDGSLYAGTSGSVFRSTQKLIIAPSAPRLTAPHDTASDVPITTSLEWQPACGATQYRLHVATDAAFTKLVLDTAALTQTRCIVSNLGSASTYFWRVQGFGSGGNGNWSDVWSFTTVLLPPPAPTLSYPANNATSVSTGINLRWNLVTAAVSYHVQVATDSGFTNLVFDQANILPTSQAVNGLANGTVHFWRVCAANAAGEGSWSTVWKFTTITSKPAVPVLVTPVDDATGQPTSPTLVWNAVSGAQTYRVQVSTNASFTTTILDQSITVPTVVAATAGSNTTHYWRVNASNTAGTSDWSAVWKFTTASAPPSPPNLIEPIDGAIVLGDTLFRWESISGAILYRLQVSTDQSFSSLVIDTNTANNSKRVVNLAKNATFFWRVSVTTAAGTSNWSATRSFTTRLAPPQAPLLISPPDRYQPFMHALQPLIWSNVATAVAYRLQVATDSLFSSTVFDTDTLTTASMKVGNYLGLGRKYFWRVNARNAGGTSPWSPVWSFTTTVDLDVEIRPSAPTSIELFPNYPNPFAQSTVIRYKLSAFSHVLLEVFDLFGRKVATLVDEEKAAGEHAAMFDVRKSSFGIHSGLYFLRLTTPIGSTTQTMTLLR